MWVNTLAYFKIRYTSIFVTLDNINPTILLKEVLLIFIFNDILLINQLSTTSHKIEFNAIVIFLICETSAIDKFYFQANSKTE